MSTPATPFHKRPLWIAVAALLAVILVVGGIAAGTGAFSGGGTPAAAPPGDATVAPDAAPAPGASALPDGAASVCGLQGYEETSSLTSAPEAKWEIIGTMAAPQAPKTAGPGVQEDDAQFRTCFAHTTEGALFATINFFATSTNPANQPRMYELLADGAARDTVRSAGGGTQQGSSTRLQVAGFKVTQYNADTATIDLAMSVSSKDGALVSQPMVVKWEHGDWKIVLTEAGPQYKPAPLTSLGGYIPFSGV
ncbi:hypothetical protein ACR8AL_01940 [Clavibacter sepedonicus]|uniref:Exported protein n=1 Tax=Clavibacter sepedonicus TaxID=31964 RepID=B0RIY0_CLASE|nr:MULTISPECIES: hypothetical protein [Clavibacter]MBD5382920.1 hypothetical protein [Clavibacter sp.]OQJ48306.1 hypothetical protein B5P19_08510 [Clavibacter sepedonicus]OQJ54446.1 hypothetical protein B5P20_10270 [Clavibacter sepedonicus]UUK66012.1 hypothetical protein LRE50_01835 [Clavibacter sepedonicus]CAQ02767.1 putative exported protein [Clavibacter sepedonicus]